jgi:uncharacterized protein with PIN domain
MYSITIRFYEELNDFLPSDMRRRDIAFSFAGRRSVKDLIESIGVPHVEVDLILVDGESVGFSHIVRDGERISVYPVFERLDIGSVTRLRPEPLRDTRFVLDVHLRKLARHLRLFGFDTLHDPSLDDPDLAALSAAEKRVLLTRDRGLLKRKIVERGLIVRNTDPMLQLVEVLGRLDLWNRLHPFSRCIECNGPVVALTESTPGFSRIEPTIPPGVRLWCHEYYHCERCDRVYWKGSHYEKLALLVKRVLDAGR